MSQFVTCTVSTDSKGEIVGAEISGEGVLEVATQLAHKLPDVLRLLVGWDFVYIGMDGRGQSLHYYVRPRAGDAAMMAEMERAVEAGAAGWVNRKQES